MMRIVVGVFGCLIGSLGSGLLCALWLALGPPGEGLIRLATVVLATHVVALIAGITLAIAKRTEIGMAVAGAPAGLFIGAFVAYHMGREMLSNLARGWPF
jgi:hypothetical protein